jgi:EpsD family peptidyl-prolyl cis-trans isomerase
MASDGRSFYLSSGVFMNQCSKLLLVLLAASSLTLGACSEKKTAATADSKVAVKVNGQAISAAEIDPQAGNTMEPHGNSISGPRINKLVDMELFRQAAVQSKLDADENVRARIATANRMILATAFLEKTISSVGKPTESEINAYYNQNPDRFAERKQYAIHEFGIEAAPGREAEIQAQLAKGNKVEEFDQWLTAKKISHGSSPAGVTSDRLSDDVLQKLKNVPVGGTALISGPKQMNVVFVLAEQKQPLTLTQAGREIANMLVEKRKRDALDNALKQLRDKAKIEYVPPYTANGLGTMAEQK